MVEKKNKKIVKKYVVEKKKPFTLVESLLILLGVFSAVTGRITIASVSFIGAYILYKNGK